MGVKERKQREKRQRSNDILEAARSVFETKGFLNTTLADVAKEAEISVGLIYRYFQSKEDIFASLALKGAEQFDGHIVDILKRASSGRKKMGPEKLLSELSDAFFAFYGPYGEYFDMLIYTHKGMKNVQIHGTTLTRLMVVTLGTLDKIKEYILKTPQFKAQDEEEALGVVFLLWGILLGCHKLFDNSGRGFLLAFNRQEFLRTAADAILRGIGSPEMRGETNISARPPGSSTGVAAHFSGAD
ncbi:MAG: TetR/AcrR family transcriptional regulator [Deltaproteobacteria bacterium]|nr:TetR/AcrR family transcriptional regulator [Deltaproteobacteria bacterium]MBI3295362.1 TetR/AcrR family transcriptional regulator [Deltaproteobacteria bacterium]